MSLSFIYIQLVISEISQKLDGERCLCKLDTVNENVLSNLGNVASPEVRRQLLTDAYTQNDAKLLEYKVKLFSIFTRILIRYFGHMLYHSESELMPEQDNSVYCEYNYLVQKVLLHEQYACRYYSDIENYIASEETGLKKPKYYKRNPNEFNCDFCFSLYDYSTFCIKFKEFLTDYASLFQSNHIYKEEIATIQMFIKIHAINGRSLKIKI